jgi:hypothetical protein
VNWRGSCLTKGVAITGRTILFLGLGVVAFASCKTIQKTREAIVSQPKIYVVSSETAPFYSHGPQQGNGPDRTLTRETLVRLIRPSFGYSKVQLLEDGTDGYVSSDDIRIASPDAIAAAKATPPPIAAISSTPAGERFDLNSSDPRLSAPPEQLPPPDLPPADTASPAPSPGQ